MVGLLQKLFIRYTKLIDSFYIYQSDIMNDKIKIYLCGPIAGCDDNEACDWRDWVIKETGRRACGYVIADGWAECLNPMRRDHRTVSQHERFGDATATPMPDHIKKEIVELDKIDITQSDVLLANMLPDKTKTGSNMEIIYAFERGKLVVLVLDPDKPISPWHWYHSHKIVGTLEEALDYIKNGNWRA